MSPILTRGVLANCTRGNGELMLVPWYDGSKSITRPCPAAAVPFPSVRNFCWQTTRWYYVTKIILLGKTPILIRAEPSSSVSSWFHAVQTCWSPLVFASFAFSKAFKFLTPIRIVSSTSTSMSFCNHPSRNMLLNAISFNSHVQKLLKLSAFTTSTLLTSWIETPDFPQILPFILLFAAHIL